MFEDVLIAHKGQNEVSNKGTFTVSGDPSERLIMISLSSDFMIFEERIMTIKVSVSFVIEKESWDRQCQGDNIVLPKDFVVHLDSLAVGIARGVLSAKTEGTQFNGYMLPLINISNIVKDDVIIPLT